MHSFAYNQFQLPILYSNDQVSEPDSILVIFIQDSESKSANLDSEKRDIL